jgi:mxaJ protein
MVVTACLIGLAWAIEPTWELRVCADPDNYPASNRQLEGYENRVAAILAAEMGATLTYEWTTIDEYAVRTKLRTGECDAIMSVAESAAGLLNSVAYYRVPFAFVSLASANRSFRSLYDPALAGMRIGVPPNSLLNKVLFDVGLKENYVPVPIDRAVRGLEQYAAMLGALQDGSVDVVMFEGPAAATIVQASNGTLRYATVEDELIFPATPMFRIATVGVRPSDEGLRDALNQAIARRWSDLAEVFVSMGIPTLSLVQPRATEASHSTLRVGLVAPLKTGTPVITDIAAQALWFGARVADELVTIDAGRASAPVEVIYANAPSAASASRAAARLVATHRVPAIVGGLGADAAAAIADVATSAGVLFMNVGASADALRERCEPLVFHVEPSDTMYATALATLLEALSVAVVYDDTPARQAIAERMVDALTQLGGVHVGAFQVPAGPAVYRDTLLQLANANSDAVVVILAPQDLEMFFAQASLERLQTMLIPFPDAVNQTRDFILRLRDVAPQFSDGLRLASWDPTLTDQGAQVVNERFAARSGEPMDPAGWAAYAGVMLLADAYRATGSQEPAILRAFIAQATQFDSLAKGQGVAFRASDQQLTQSLYHVAVDVDAPYDLRVSGRVALARVVATLPADLSAQRTSGADQPGETCTP